MVKIQIKNCENQAWKLDSLRIIICRNIVRCNKGTACGSKVLMMTTDSNSPEEGKLDKCQRLTCVFRIMSTCAYFFTRVALMVISCR